MAIKLLSNPDDHDGAEMTFRRAADGIRAAERSVEIYMFVWRSDGVGNEIGRAVLDAAGRGVEVTIIKDVGAFMYERIEVNRKSFFPKPVSWRTRMQYAIVRPTFPKSYVEDAYDQELGPEVMAHPKVTMTWVNHTHTKYYVFDEGLMLTGSINIEDRHRGYRDYMVEISGGDEISRFRSRQLNDVPYDPERPLDFVFNHPDGGAFEIKPRMLEIIDGAAKSIYIEMAYVGDPDATRKIIEASRRGVAVTILFSREANIGNDLNYRTIRKIFRDGDIKLYLSDKMIHSKLVMADDEVVIMGSANMSVFSMTKAVELDVVMRDNPDFIGAVKEVMERRIAEGHRVESLADLKNFNRLLASLQQLHQMIVE